MTGSTAALQKRTLRQKTADSIRKKLGATAFYWLTNAVIGDTGTYDWGEN
jgi:hypothetical protein